ncbi:MAG TPA: DUF2203 domain-containing protein [Candidatus Sulfopaludibacter sp.]|jgi:hypothetical protein|nr:DUF2203 domain-containing protein [Candidatus Sulfopaludibacter sp.]
MFNFYTPDQANELLPEIKRRFNKIIDKRNEIILIQSELNNIIDGYQSFKIFFDKKKELNKTISLLYKEVEEIEEFGILIKSLDEGLVDFPSKRFDEEVWLCWKVEEEKIRFWHGKNEGFIGRKPLSVKGTYSEDNLEDLR